MDVYFPWGTSFYVVADEDIVKCGIANQSSLSLRLRTHRSQGLVRVLTVIDFERGFDAMALEAMWREYVRGLRSNGQWVVSPERLPDGFTEALPITGYVMDFIAELVSIEVTDEAMIESLALCPR